MDRIKLSIITEVVGIATIISGIAYETIANEPVGNILLMAGSVLIALGSLVWKKVIKAGE